MKRIKIKKEKSKIQNKTLLIIICISYIAIWLLPIPYDIIPLGIELLCAFIIISRCRKKTIKAYNIHGGGACPTQFYWNDKKYFYYFRLRNGYYRLYKGKVSPDDIEYFHKSKIIAEGEYGDDIEGYITFNDMIILLMFHNIFLDIHGKPVLTQLDFTNL